MGYLKNKPGSVEEAVRNLSKHTEDSEYQKMFKKELEKTGKGLASMSDVEKKNFFNMIDKKYKKESDGNGTTMTGMKKTKVETEPKINYNMMIPFIILYITIVDVKKIYNLSYTPLLMSLLLTILIFKFIL